MGHGVGKRVVTEFQKHSVFFFFFVNLATKKKNTENISKSDKNMQHGSER